MRIRKARLADSAEIARLHRATIRAINANDYSPAEIKEWSGRSSAKRFRSSHGKAFRYVAVEGEKIVGFADFNKENPENYWGLYVHKDFLGRGIGSRLMKKMEEAAKKMGAKKFVLSATKTAKAFYEKQGFKVNKKSKHPVEDQKLDVYVMIKRF